MFEAKTKEVLQDFFFFEALPVILIKVKSFFVPVTGSVTKLQVSDSAIILLLFAGQVRCLASFCLAGRWKDEFFLKESY